MSSAPKSSDLDQSHNENSEASQIRSIQKRDLSVVTQFMKEYTEFNQLSREDQLDRVVLVLHSACGFGAICNETIQQLKPIAGDRFANIDLDTHFKNSEYENVKSGEKKNRYRESFPGGYRLDREYRNQMTSEGDESLEDEPIRKKVVKKVTKAPAPIVKNPKKPASSDRPSQKPTQAQSVNLSTKNVEKIAETAENPSDSSSRFLIVVGSAVVLGVIITVAILFINF